MQIEIYGDVVCPWCYIGETRLEKALAQRPDLQIERIWRPFQLQPGMPAKGKDWAEFAHEKFGGLTNMNAAFSQVTTIGAQEGLKFDFSQVVSAPNTVDAHRLILWANAQGREREMATHLFAAYFSQGCNLNDVEQLLEVVTAVGLDPTQARTFLASNDKRAEVEASQLEANQNGIHSVPTFIINEQYALTGAVPVSTLLKALDYVASVSAS